MFAALTKRIEQPDGRDGSLIPPGSLPHLAHLTFVENIPERHKRRPKPLRIEFVASRQPDRTFPYPLRRRNALRQRFRGC